MSTDGKGVDRVTVAELDDEPGKVYAFGIDADSFSQNGLKDFLDETQDRFEHAEAMVVSLPIEGRMEISEVDPEDFKAIRDYNDAEEVTDG